MFHALTRRWVSTLVGCACLCMGTAAHAQSSLGVLRTTGRGVAAELSAEIDRVVMSELAQSFGVEAPVVPPTDYEEILLNIGCEGDDRECLSATAETIQVDEVVLRDLSIDGAGRSVLRMMRFKPGEDPGPVRAEAASPPGSEPALAREVPRLMRAIFGIAEPPPPAPSTTTAPVTIAPASTRAQPEPAVAPATTSNSDGASVGPLTWTLLISGAVVLGAGIAIGLSANAGYEDFKSKPIRTEDDARDARSEFAAVETQGLVSSVLMPVGGAALGLGAVLLALDLSGGQERSSDTASLRVAPLIDGAVLTFSSPTGAL